jgi:hypothetical protein
VNGLPGVNAGLHGLPVAVGADAIASQSAARSEWQEQQLRLLDALQLVATGAELSSHKFLL